jgi:methylase of polypeptide subunit release factors
LPDVTIGEVPREREVAFGPLTIRYDERVLSPRPWTVLQASWAADLLPGLPPGEVLELCCGAGQIGLLAASGADRDLVLVDADPQACAYARSNAEQARAQGLGPRGDVHVRHGRLEEALQADERFALVLADPPWVRTAQVSDHPGDPAAAIDGGADGLDVVRDCLAVIDRHLLPGGASIVQVADEEQVDAVAAYLSENDHDLRRADHRLAEPGALVLLRRRDE